MSDSFKKVETEDGTIEYEVVADSILYSEIGKITDKRDGPDVFRRNVEELRQLKGLSSSEKAKLSRKINANEELLKSHKGKDGSKTKTLTEEQLIGYGHFDLVEPPYNLENLGQLYEINSTHKAAIDAKVAATVGLGYEWSNTSNTEELISNKTGSRLENARKRIARLKVELDEWLEDINDEYTWQTILENWVKDFETFGNGYLEIGRIQKGPNKGKIGYVGHVPAHTIRVRKDRDGFIQIVANKVIFFRNYGEDTPNPIGGDREPNEIIHIKKYAPRNTYYGIPDIIPAISAIAGIEFATKFNLDYFEHKAVPRYIIVVKGATITAATEKNIAEFFQNSVKGKNHRSVLVPLSGINAGKDADFKIMPVETGIQDASFIKYYEKNRDEILMTHRTPGTKVGLTSDVSLAVSRDSDKMFKETVTRPLQRIIEKRLRPIFRELTDVVDFKLKELTLTDEETVSKIHEKYLRWQVMTPNEAREKLGLKGLKGGDKVIDSFNSQAKAEQTAQSRQSRTRDSERGSGPDSGQADGRNAAGEGRSTP